MQLPVQGGLKIFIAVAFLIVAFTTDPTQTDTLLHAEVAKWYLLQSKSKYCVFTNPSAADKYLLVNCMYVFVLCTLVSDLAGYDIIHICQ